MKVKYIFILATLLLLLTASVAVNIHAVKSGNSLLANAFGGWRYAGSASDDERQNDEKARNSGYGSKGFADVNQGNLSLRRDLFQSSKDNGAKRKTAGAGSKERSDVVAKTIARAKDAKNSKKTSQGHGGKPFATSEKPLTIQRFERDYAAFFAKHSLSEGQQELIRIALDKNNDFTLSLMRRGELGKGDMEVRMANVEEGARLLAEALRGSIGDETFEAFVYYQKTLSQRRLANEIAGQIAVTGSELSADQVDLLVDVLKKNGVRYDEEWYRLRIPYASKNILRSLTSAESNVMREAGAIINPNQAEAMRFYWDGLVSKINSESVEN
ncbi:hypothetical protein OH491_12375 [Termitidicoccus mucosus]